MLALTHALSKRVSRLTIHPRTNRSFAEVTNAISSNESSASAALVNPRTPSTNVSRNVRIPVREDHGLYTFFRRKDDGNLVGDAKYEVVETPEKMQKETGRAWKASELRLKSFSDLHTLWYILLRERNLLATQKEEVRRMGVTNTETQVSLRKVHQCRKTMARIKAVINERRLAYEGAVRLVEQQREEQHNSEVQQYLTGVWKTERKYLQRRRAHKTRRLEAKQTDKGNADATLSINNKNQTSATEAKEVEPVAGENLVNEPELPSEDTILVKTNEGREGARETHVAS